MEFIDRTSIRGCDAVRMEHDPETVFGIIL